MMQNEKQLRQFGLWDSPISPVSLAHGIRFGGLAWDRDGSLVWLEMRSDRGVLVVQPPDGQAPRDLNAEISVRARVGYGGGDFTVGAGNVYFADAGSGRLYTQPVRNGSPRPLTPAFGYAAAPTLSPDGRWLVFVRTYEGKDTLEIVDAAGSCWPQILVQGEDFYMQPAWHPQGERIAWVCWNHPNMPWDGTLLRVGKLAFHEGTLPVVSEVETVAGSLGSPEKGGPAIFQPQFSPDGRYLAYVSDETGWGQLYLYDFHDGRVRQLTHAEAEHGAPGWVQGIRRYGFSPDGSALFFLRNQAGFFSLWQLNLGDGSETKIPIDEEYTFLDHPDVSPDGDRLAVVASGGATPSRVMVFNLKGEASVRRRSASEELPASEYSRPQAITWQGMDGGLVHGLYYPPHNQSFESHGAPPLILLIHGGPTSQVPSAFSPQVQFFTSRGYAVLDVNYRGSTGYGRAYMDMLRGNWGIYDVEDAVSGAQGLVEKGLVDSSRIVIMGGSAGGFTVLKAMEDFGSVPGRPGFFKAGICLYGVSNQFTLAAETHKFEARYSDSLIGPLPEAAALYRERSPIFFVEKITEPLAIFQGEIDQVVPRKQSDEVAESLRRRGIPYIYHVYPGEGHGFRKTETIEHFYQAVDQFLRQFVIFA